MTHSMFRRSLTTVFCAGLSVVLIGCAGDSRTDNRTGRNTIEPTETYGTQRNQSYGTQRDQTYGTQRDQSYDIQPDRDGNISRQQTPGSSDTRPGTTRPGTTDPGTSNPGTIDPNTTRTDGGVDGGAGTPAPR